MGVFWLAILWAFFIGYFVYLIADRMAGFSAYTDQKLKTRVEGLIVRKANIQRVATLSNIMSLNQALKRQAFTRNLLHLLSLSGWGMPMSVFILVDLLCGAVAFLIGFLVFKNFFLALPVALVAVFIPYWLLVVNKQRYCNHFTAVLPDALMLMKNALKSGQGLQSAFQMVAEEGPQPVAKEIGHMLQEIQLGNQLAEALGELYRRIGTVDLRIFVLGIFIQQEVGGNLVELFEHIEKTIRERISMSREISVLSAQGKMTGTVLFLLPIIVAGILLVINPGYFKPILEHPQGRKILIFAFFWQLVGGWIIKKITTFKLA